MLLLKRHFLVGLIAAVLVYLFVLSRPEWNSMHAWNRAYADVSLLFLLITIIIGPLSRINRKCSRFLSWRRELGIWTCIMAFLHVYELFNGWFYWELVRLIIGVSQETGKLTFDPGFTLANLIGVVGLIYLTILAILSNNKAIKIFGKRSWDYLQNKSGVLYILTIFHTTFFLFIFRLGQDNWMKVPFLVAITLILLLKCTAFIFTVLKYKGEKWCWISMGKIMKITCYRVRG